MDARAETGAERERLRGLALASAELDAQGRLLGFNGALLELLAAPPSAGAPWTSLFAPEARVDATARWHERPGAQSWPALTTSGHPVRVSLGPPDEEGRVLLQLHSRQEAQALQQQLERSEQVVGLIDGLMGVGHWILYNGGQRLFWSEQTHRIHGTDPETYTPDLKDGISAYVPEDQARVQQAVAEALDSGRPFEFDAQIIRADGERRNVRAAGRPAPRSSMDLLGVFQDVTDLLSLQERLRVSEERFALAVSASLDGLWDWDPTSGSLWWSPRFMEIVGVSPDHFQPRFEEFEDRLHPDDRARTLDAVTAHLERRVPYDIEFRLRHEDGHYLWIRAKGRAVWNAAGQPTRMVGVVSDITVEKTQARLLEQRTEDLTAQNEALDRFAANAGHDLKSPLRKIATFVERGLERDPTEPKVRDDLERARNAARRLSRMVDDLLDYARLSTLKEATQVVRLEDTVREALEPLAPILADVSHELVLPALPAVLGHPALLEQLFRNLFDNALKYRHPERPLRLEVRTHPDAEGRVGIQVRDNGLGFSKADAERILLPFERASHVQSSGAGFGLPQCQRIAEVHGSRLEAHGEPDQGATFGFTLALTSV